MCMLYDIWFLVKLTVLLEIKNKTDYCEIYTFCMPCKQSEFFPLLLYIFINFVQIHKIWNIELEEDEREENVKVKEM